LFVHKSGIVGVDETEAFFIKLTNVWGEGSKA